MAGFNLDSYETVEQRHARAIAAYPDLRCVVVNHTTPADRSQGVWVVERDEKLIAELVGVAERLMDHFTYESQVD